MTTQKNKKRLVRARMAKTGESHQAAHRAVSKAVARPPVLGAAPSASAEGMVGRVIAGRYRLLRVVPEAKVPVAGGPVTGGAEPAWALYDAHHVLLGIDVAIKLISTVGRSDAPLRAWLLREGRALPRAAHAQVTKVFDIGETEEEELYLVLERAPATTLGAYLEARPMVERTTLDVVQQLAQLFAHFHDKGVTPFGLHNGIIHLEERGDSFAVKIGSLPFAGLAGDPGLPPPSPAFKNAAWMSPEECRGEEGDARSALYTLGIVLYTMLGRRLPFEHESRSKLLDLQREAVPPPLRAPGAPASPLDAICLRLLAKDPQARYPSATALVQALRGVAS
jgi:eukaryotic-like serine/threonine-protein kinase